MRAGARDSGGYPPKADGWTSETAASPAHATPDARPSAAALVGGAADVAEVRRHFPALARQHNGLPVAYFDGPGGTQVPSEVVGAMAEYLFHHNANTHWPYPTSAETDAAIAAARHALADFLGATPEEVAFGQNMTTLTFHLARALGRRWGPGDEVVVTELDHHANVDPWHALARERGITVRVAAVRPESGTLDVDDLARQLTPRTRLLAIGAASNAVGTITDVAAAAELARERGAPDVRVFVDAVHYAPHALVDVARLGCDFLACSAYKFYGPHVGVLYGRRELLQSLDVPKLAPAPDLAPERVETGTLNHEGMAGAAAAVDFLASLAPHADGEPHVGHATPVTGAERRARLARTYEAMHAGKRALFARLWEGLSRIDRVTLYGPPPEAARTPTAAFAVRGRAAEDAARALAERALFVTSGDFYASTLVARLGHAADGLLRAGIAAYTTADEIDRLVEGVREIAR